MNLNLIYQYDIIIYLNLGNCFIKWNGIYTLVIHNTLTI